jgi:uroporphyrinogen decarboxylase
MSYVFPKAELIATMQCREGALLPCKLDWPIQKVCYWGGDPRDCRPVNAERWEDLWGVDWRKESPDPSMTPFPVGHPMAGSLENLDRYNWPDADDDRLFADLAHLRPLCNQMLIGVHPSLLYERAWLLTGLSQLPELMETNPAQVDELFARICEFERGIGRRYIELGVEAAWLADDYGTNRTQAFGPDLWRRFVKPHLQQIVQLYHEADRMVILHSYGNLGPLVDDFLEIGIDVLDPLQPNCNRLDHIRNKTKGRICLCGGVASSVLLADNTARTAADTRQRIHQLGADGGYIVGPDDEWEYPTAASNAMLEQVEYFRDLNERG